MEKLLNYEEDRDKIMNDDEDEEAELKKKQNEAQKEAQNGEGDEEAEKKKGFEALDNKDQNEKKEINLEEFEDVDKDLPEYEDAEIDEEEVKIDDEKIRRARIIQQLKKKILYPLKRHMHDFSSQENKEKTIRTNTAVAICKVKCEGYGSMVYVQS